MSTLLWATVYVVLLVTYAWYSAMMEICNFSFDPSRAAVTCPHQWFANVTLTSRPSMSVLQAAVMSQPLIVAEGVRFAFYSSSLFFALVAARFFIGMVCWVLQVLCFSVKAILRATIVVILASYAKDVFGSALAVIRVCVLVIIGCAFLGLVWWGIDALWLFCHGGAKKSIPYYVPPTTKRSTTTATPTAPAPVMPTRATQQHTTAPSFWGELTLAARSVLVIASPLFALLALFPVGVFSATALRGAIHHAWVLVIESVGALGAKIVRGIKRFSFAFTVLCAIPVALAARSDRITIVYPHTGLVELVEVKVKPTVTRKTKATTNKTQTAKTLPAYFEKARKRQRAAKRRVLLAPRPTSAATTTTRTDILEISRFTTTTATNTDVPATPKLTRCKSAPRPSHPRQQHCGHPHLV